MKGKKFVIYIIILILMLLTSSFITSGIGIKNFNIKKEELKINNDEIQIYVGKMIIDCEWDSIACNIDIIDNPYDIIDIDSKSSATIIFYADWEIINEKAASKEKWEFKITLKNGNKPGGEVIHAVEKTIEDTPIIPDNQNGTIYFGYVELRRDDFESKPFSNEPDVVKFRSELECYYYEGSWIDGELEERSDKSLWTVARIGLENDKPSAPVVTGDIEEGGTGKIGETYSFTAKSSIDPDGDLIRYSFDWHDGVVDGSDYIESGGSVKMGHQWNDDAGAHSVSIYAYDRFGAMSSGTTISFTLPRSIHYKNLLFQRILSIFKEIFTTK
jgi:hypothetical protein